MRDVESHGLLVLLGLLLGVAFLAEEVFKLFKVPPVLVLLACGYLIGPVAGLVSGDELLRSAPLFGALAFLLILFEGGLDLDLDRTLGALRKAARLSFGCFLLAAAGGFGMARMAGFEASSALLVGIVLAPISGAILIPLLGRVPLADDLRAILVLEAALADVLGVIALAFAARVVDGGGWRSLLAVGTVLGVVAGVAAGVAAGLLWPRAMRLLGERRYVEVLTFGLVLTLWGTMTAIGASAALAVLAFGVTLANEDSLRERLGWSGVEEARERDKAESLHSFVAQLNFLVRAFFFVFIGVVVRFGEASRSLWLVAAGSIVFSIAVRATLVRRELQPFVGGAAPAPKWLLVLMQPRGLVTAVLALEAEHLGLPGSGVLLPVGSIVILATNVLLAFGLMRWGTRIPGAGAAASPAPGRT